MNDSPVIYTIDQRGHRFTSRDEADMTDMEVLMSINPLMVGMLPSKVGLWACNKCDESPYNMVIDQEARTITAPTECPLANGIVTHYSLEVPSGVMVVANDLRSLFGVPHEYGDGMPSYNSDLGQSQYMLGLAQEFKLAYGPVGNTSPCLYTTEAGFEIATAAWDVEAGDVIHPAEPLAHIITDLWAFCIADSRVFQGKLNEQIQRGEKPYDEQYTMVGVEPGTYQFTHHTGELGFDHDSYDRIVYTTIRKA